jgi:hypothetical protein
MVKILLAIPRNVKMVTANGLPSKLLTLAELETPILALHTNATVLVIALLIPLELMAVLAPTDLLSLPLVKLFNAKEVLAKSTTLAINAVHARETLLSALKTFARMVLAELPLLTTVDLAVLIPTLVHTKLAKTDNATLTSMIPITFVKAKPTIAINTDVMAVVPAKIISLMDKAGHALEPTLKTIANTTLATEQVLALPVTEAMVLDAILLPKPTAMESTAKTVNALLMLIPTISELALLPLASELSAMLMVLAVSRPYLLELNAVLLPILANLLTVMPALTVIQISAEPITLLALNNNLEIPILLVLAKSDFAMDKVTAEPIT